MKPLNPQTHHRWRSALTFVTMCGVTLSGLPVLAAESVPSEKAKGDSSGFALSIDPTVRVDATKGLSRSDTSVNGYLTPYARIKIETPYGVQIVTDVDLRRITSGSTLRADEVPHMIHRAQLMADALGGQFTAGVGRVNFGPDENSDYDGRTIFGSRQDSLTNMDERFLASYKIQLSGNVTLTATLFSSAAPGTTVKGNSIKVDDLMDPKFGSSSNLSGAVKADVNLDQLIKGLGAQVSYAYVRQGSAGDDHRIAAGLSYARDIGQVSTQLLVQYARIVTENGADLQSFLAYARANLKDKPWGLYCQFDRTDEASTLQAVNTIEVGVDYTHKSSVINTKLLGGVFVRDSESEKASVGLGASAIFTAANPIRLGRSE